MGKELKNVLAIGIGIIPFNVLMVWYRLTHAEGFTLADMLIYPLLFGGGVILLILALNRFLLKQPSRSFNPGKGKWYWDIIYGIGLTLVYFILVYIERPVLMPVLPQGKPPSAEVIKLMTGLANNPVLLVIWLGPVVWFGIALFEEVQRVFFMNCLWTLSASRTWAWVTVLVVATVWGFMHFYQGPFGIISVSIQGLVMGAFYINFRRIWPLIISHALYDSIQIVMFVVQVS